jgi:hypothetical protein
MPAGRDLLAFLSQALNQTDTRDSLTEVMQYAARLFAGTLPGEQLAARRVYKSLSEGRKILRLFRFIPEINNLIKISNSDSFKRHLATSQSAAIILFFMLDNWIYFIETVKNKSRGDIRPLKLLKNRISLLRIALSLTLTVAELQSVIRCKNGQQGERPTTYRQLLIRFWHECLRLWLTLHKLHMLEAFTRMKELTESNNLLQKNLYDIIPGAVGLAAAVTGFLRRTVLK